MPSTRVAKAHRAGVEGDLKTDLLTESTYQLIVE